VKRLLAYVSAPPTLDAPTLQQFYAATKLMIGALAGGGGVRSCAHRLFADKYGDILNRQSLYWEMFMLHIDGSAIAVERIFGVLDDYIRNNQTMTKLRCCLFLLIQGADLEQVLARTEFSALPPLIASSARPGPSRSITCTGRPSCVKQMTRSSCGSTSSKRPMGKTRSA
jgi:hypothetical protein